MIKATKKQYEKFVERCEEDLENPELTERDMVDIVLDNLFVEFGIVLFEIVEEKHERREDEGN